MSPMTAQEQARTLAEVEALLSDRRRWTSAHYHRRDLFGRDRYCLVGAWMHVCGDDPETLDIQAKAQHVYNVRDALGLPRGLSPFNLNDYGGYDIVMHVIRAARRRAVTREVIVT